MPLDVAQAAEATELVGWLQDHNARSSAEIG
jgi:erythromycin esterase-like protein